MLCPICKTNPAYVGLIHVGACESCNSPKGEAVAAVPHGTHSDPTGLVGAPLHEWLSSNPGVSVGWSFSAEGSLFGHISGLGEGLYQELPGGAIREFAEMASELTCLGLVEP